MRIDIHVHLLASSKQKGAFISRRLKRTVSYWGLLKLLGLGKLKGEELDSAYLDLLLDSIQTSSMVDKAVILALDGRYDQKGELDLDKSDIYIPNNYILKVAKEHDCLLAGASINPLRKDAVDELLRVIEAGAVLIKLLPNSQDFDPLDPGCIPFYREAASQQIPLLFHTGFEHAFPVTNQTYGCPSRLTAALDEGCIVIAAHCGTTGIRHLHECYPQFVDLMQKYSNLYGDVSALVNASRFNYLKRVLAEECLKNRLILGSDFPVPPSVSLVLPRIGLKKGREINKEKNYIEKNALLIKAVGFDDSVFTLGAKVLGIN